MYCIEFPRILIQVSSRLFKCFNFLKHLHSFLSFHGAMRNLHIDLRQLRVSKKKEQKIIELRRIGKMRESVI